jgi:hypothetical protein
MTITPLPRPEPAWFLNGISNLQSQQTQVERSCRPAIRCRMRRIPPGQTPELIDLGSSLSCRPELSDQSHACAGGSEHRGPVNRIGHHADPKRHDFGYAGSEYDIFRFREADTGATQVQAIQQQIVSSRQHNCRRPLHIFGGDQDQTAPYSIRFEQRDRASTS